jgi:hypothetical protein
MRYVYQGCCGRLAYERKCSLEEYEHDPTFRCPNCETFLPQMLTAAHVMVKDMRPFRSPVDGSIITNQRELAEHNRRNNVVNLHDGYDEKAIMDFPNRDWHTTPVKERLQDLAGDMDKAVEKLQDGYKPSPAQYTEDISHE